MGPGPLQDRNVIVDEMYQLKKEIRLAQMESRRMGEELVQRLGVVDGRLQAGEQNLRTLDKRETSNTNLGQQAHAENDLKMREVVAEMGRFKRQVEAEMRGVVDGMKTELRQREGLIQQLDNTCRGLALQIKAGEESRAGADRDMKAAVERRFQQMQDAMSRQEQQFLDRGLALERVLQREADERAAADAQVRQELDSALQAMKGLTGSEAGARVLMHKELRQQIADTSKALHEQVVLVREEADRGRQALSDMCAEERTQRELVTSTCQRKVDNFIRLYEVERQRLDKGVKDALAQILERTRGVHALSKRMQEEGTDLRRIAARVQDESAVAVRSLSEMVEDSLRGLVSTQDRHTQQIMDLKSAHNVDTQEIRDRLSQALAKVQGEIDKNFREDRLARESHAQRMHEWSEQVKGLEKGAGGRLAALEQTLGRDVELAKRDIDDVRHASRAAAEEIKEDLEEYRRRVGALETQTETALKRALGDMRAAQSQAAADTLDAKSLVRGLVTTATGTMRAHATRIEELERVLRLHQGRMEEVLRTGEALATSGAVLSAKKAPDFDGPRPDVGVYLDEEFDEPAYGEEEERAAVKIQAVARGSQERKAITGSPAKKVVDVESYDWPGRQGGGDGGYGGGGGGEKPGMSEEERAAVKIQAVARGSRDRKAITGPPGGKIEPVDYEWPGRGGQGVGAVKDEGAGEAAAAGSERGVHDDGVAGDEEEPPHTPGDDDFEEDFDQDVGVAEEEDVAQKSAGEEDTPQRAEEEDVPQRAEEEGDASQREKEEDASQRAEEEDHAPKSARFGRRDSEAAASGAVASMVRDVSQALSSEGAPSLPVSKPPTAGAGQDEPPHAEPKVGERDRGAWDDAPVEAVEEGGDGGGVGEDERVHGEGDAGDAPAAPSESGAGGEVAEGAPSEGDAHAAPSESGAGGEDAERAPSAAAHAQTPVPGAVDAEQGSAQPAPSDAADTAAPQGESAGSVEALEQPSAGSWKQSPEGSEGGAEEGEGEAAPSAEAGSEGAPTPAPESQNSVPKPTPESSAGDEQRDPSAVPPPSENSVPTPAPESVPTDANSVPTPAPGSVKSEQPGAAGAEPSEISGHAEEASQPDREKDADAPHAGDDGSNRPPAGGGVRDEKSPNAGSDKGSTKGGEVKGSVKGSDEQGSTKGSEKQGSDEGSEKKGSGERSVERPSEAGSAQEGEGGGFDDDFDDEDVPELPL